MQSTLLRRRTGRGRHHSRRIGSRKANLILFGLVIAALLGFGVYLGIKTLVRPASPNTPILAAHYFVKGKLAPAMLAYFSPPEWTTVETDKDGIVTVTGTVEVVPKNGSTAATYLYKCVVHSDPARGSWDLINVDLMKQ
jgi:hypothetical protein